jgi:hypothetical protein
MTLPRRRHEVIVAHLGTGDADSSPVENYAVAMGFIFRKLLAILRVRRERRNRLRGR